MDPNGRGAGPQGNRGTSRGDPSVDERQPPPSGGIELRSAAFSDHTIIPNRYSRDGGNISPRPVEPRPVEWAHVPAGTAELALICEDPDAPSGTFVHWVLAGISPDSTEIVEDQVPETAVVGRNGFGELGWGGPQPPIGDEPHRYFFHLYAVDRPLGLR
ncbi:MAG: YbhB/YbcL family Raf kinase inhibitor-like protein [Actinomycetota bacterium]|nr:YbhB/YbcL family Raf kinase inhibitor-like protein [Actinomycetota bacterium]